MWGTVNLLDGTTEFMHLAGQLKEPAFEVECEDWQLYPEARRLRMDLLEEEYIEYTSSEIADDLVGVVDGLLDIIVIAWGSLLTYIGEEKAKAAAAEVLRSNLSKVDGSLGPIRRRGDGKILKPEGWTPPDIKGVLRG